MRAPVDDVGSTHGAHSSPAAQGPCVKNDFSEDGGRQSGTHAPSQPPESDACKVHASDAPMWQLLNFAVGSSAFKSGAQSEPVAHVSCGKAEASLVGTSDVGTHAPRGALLRVQQPGNVFAGCFGESPF